MKNFSRQNIIELITGLFLNKAILDNFSESDNKELLYNGKEIGSGKVTISPDSNNAIKQRNNGIFVQDLSSHVLSTIYSESGSHGLRYYNNNLEYYYNDTWNKIAINGSGGNTTIITDKDIILSSSANNALVKYSNGYYVQAFMISQQANNALVKYSDGYYVPKIPANNATIDDIDVAVDKINDKITEQNQTFNQIYNTITTKISEISANTTKHKTHEFSGNTVTLTSIIDISTLYSLTSNVILNLEFMIKNNSDTDILNIKILENEIETLNDILTKSEIQRYKLPNIPNIEIFIQGNYDLFLYVNYI